MFRRSSLRSGKLTRRKRIVFFVKLCFVLVLILGMCAGFVYLMHRPEITIATLIVSGANVVDEAEIKGIVREVIGGAYLWLFPKSNALLYPKHAVETALTRNLLRIKEAEARRDGFTGLAILVEEREPHALWCGENRLEGAVPACFFIDETGFIYAPAPDFTDDVYFRYYGPLVKSDPLGQFYLPEEEYRRLSLFFASLEDYGVEARELAIRDNTDYEFYLEDDIQVLFARQQDLSRVLENLLAVVDSEDFKAQDRFSIDYIDLRFGNKVYYKLK